jgi:enamine deaminase RidA (YjgF/YER057c/UK114 family)
MGADGTIVGRGDVVAQFRQTCSNIQSVLAAAGGEMSDLVKLTIYVLDVAEYKKNLKPIGEVYRQYFGKHFPAMTLVGARDLFDAADGALIEIEGVAAVA